MMKTIIFLLIILLPNFSIAQNQERIVINEDFSDNAYNWWIGNNEDIKAEIANGVYQIMHKPIDGSSIFYVNSQLMYYDEYHFTINIQQEQGNLDNYYGLYINKNNSFLINSQEEFNILYNNKSISHGISKSIHALDTNNCLEIIRKNNETSFYVNNIKIYSTSDYIFSGSKVGWILYNNSKITINDFKIFRTPKPYSFIEDFNDNSHEWEVDSSNNYSCSVAKGYYNISYYQEGYGSTFYQNIYSFKGDNNYSIETRFKILSGTDGDGFGLYLSNTKNDEEYYFYVKSMGKYKERYIKNNTDTVYTYKTLPKPFSVSDDYLNLKMKHNKNFVYFFINNELVDSIRYKGFSGNKVGFVIYDKMNVKVDYLHINIEPDTINTILDAQKGYKKINLGKNINTQNNELAPVISSDEQLIFFVREKDSSISKLWGQDNQDIFYSQKEADDQWSIAKNVGKPLNNSGNNFVISIAPDKNNLLLANIYNSLGEVGGEGASVSHKTTDGWSIPKKIDITNFYNKNEFVSYVLSPDRKALVLALERDDSFGGKDFYVSFNLGEDSWSEPKNMGDVINSYKDEFSPFIALDNKTMYFASYGFQGFGSSDIFVTHRLDDTWLNWSEPQNMGSEINSSDWDAYFSIPANGKVAYIVSNKNTFGSGDIFMITIPKSAQPEPVALVEGKVLNSKTKDPIGTQIRSYDLKSNTESGIALSNHDDGSYSIILPYGKAYSFMAEKEGFYPVSENIDLTIFSKYVEIKKDLLLAPIEKGEIIRLNNIFFETDKTDLLSESYFELDRLIDILKTQKSIKIEISGHTDNRGAEEYNLSLSNLRAASVMNYLISNGIDKGRLVAKGYGESNPITDNETEEGRKQNRRVEFVILEK